MPQQTPAAPAAPAAPSLTPGQVTVNGAPKSEGCVFYEEALGELLRLLVNDRGIIEHVHCSQRNEGVCEWRADWRPN